MDTSKKVNKIIDLMGFELVKYMKNRLIKLEINDGADKIKQVLR